MKIGINLTVAGVKAAIADHFEMFFWYVPDQPFDEIHDRNGFFDIFFILMAIVVESNHTPIIFINPGSGYNRPAKIAADVLYNRFRITKIGFGINIKPLFMVVVAFRFYQFKRRAYFRFHLIKKGSTESITQISIVEVLDVPPKTIIAVTAFGDETMNMRSPL